MSESIGRGVLDPPHARGMTFVAALRYFTVIASEAKQSTKRHKERMDCFASLAMTRTGPRVESQQRRLLPRDRIAGRNSAAGDHFGIDAAVGVAEPALQRLRDGKVARGSIRIDIDSGAADDALHHAGAGEGSDRDVLIE